MPRFDAEGSFHYHLILFLVFLFLFITLKNVNFQDLWDSPLLTQNQYNFSWVIFAIMVIEVVVASLRGYRIKTPEHMTLGTFALVLVSLGIFIIFFNLIWDPVVHSVDHEIGGMGTVSMALSSLLVAGGMVIYINIKFTEEREQKWFIEAVKDTLNRMEVAEYRPMAQRASRSRPRRGKKVKAAEAGADYSGLSSELRETPMDMPQTVPTQTQPSVQRGAAQAGFAGGAQVAPLPQSPKIIKCPGCSVPLKVPDVPTRPLNIRCPHCGSIGTVHD